MATLLSLLNRGFCLLFAADLGPGRRRWWRGVLLSWGFSSPFAADLGPGPEAVAEGRAQATGQRLVCTFHCRPQA